MVSFEEDEIVISGISGHFPETDTLDELVSNLMNGVDMVTEERPRWEPGHLGVPMRTGKMKTLEKCDAQYFGLIAKQCHSLDPITRKVLERTYEAVVDAGLNPANFAGTNTGVFIGVSIVETEMCLMTAKDSNPYNILGRNRTMNANRVSYWLDLKGPSMSVDSSWLSGLQALTFGYEYIKSGICEMAIVAAGSSIIHANFSKHFSNLELLSPDGTSRSFDEAANGWARSEAVVVLLLQKLKHAKRNYGIIVNSMCTCISSIPSRLIVPSKEQWLKVYKEFYENCNVDPEQIAFLEADGMACPEADAAELNAANEFFCRDRDSSRPLLVGSVKTNMGHTMATAGLCSVVKALIANKTGVIPPNLHYNQPNKSILGLLSGTMKVVTEPTPLEGEYIAVSSFGYGGTFGHCVIKRPSVRVPPPAPADSIPTLVLLSGRDEEGVKATLNAVESLPYSPEYIRLIHDVFSKNLANHIYRGYTILPKGDTPLWSVESYQGAKRPVWFVFSGMGSHWATMARDLMRFPIFKQSIDVCHKVLQTKGIDLWDIMTRDDSSIFDNIVHSFVSISSTQVALVDILFSLGIQPDGIVGHSAGELGAAYADGCLTREEMILASYSRGKVSNEVKVINGLMAAVGAGYAEMKDRLPEDVEVACHNSSTSCTISGPTEKIIAVVEKLKQEGMFVRTVNTSNIPYHSKHIRDLGPRLNEELLQVITNPKKRSKKWISSSVPQSKWHEPEWGVCSAEYLTNNLLSPVLFEEACKHIPKNAIIIEIAPHSMLLSVLKRSLSKDCSIIGLTHRNAPDQLVHLLQSIGKLYTIGLQPQVSNLDPKVDFPVSLNTPFLGNLVTWDHSLSWSTNADVEEVSTKMSKVFNLYLDENPHLRGFRYDEKSILPCSVLLNLIVEAFFTMKNMNMSEVGVTLSDVFFTKPIEISKIRNLELEVTKNIGSGEFEILMGDEVVATGFAKESDPKARSDLYFDQVRSPKITMSEDEVYSQLEHLGYQYQGCFRNIKKLSVDNFVWESEVEWKKNLINLIESSIQCHLLASSHPDYLQEVKFIRELTLEPSLLPKTDAEIRLTLDTKTRVMKSAGINVKDLKFKLMEMEPLQLNCEKTLVSTRTGNESKFAYIQYSSKNVTSKQIGYSTKTSSGTNIIGVGTFEDATKSIRPDDILFWQIPEKWSLDEAATMPFPYCLAFYIIEIIADIKKGDSILITNADSNIGLACIAVALQHTTDVWAVVETKESKQLLTKKFQQLKNVAVVERASEMFNSILPRKKSRVDMVINIGWERKIEHCLDCMGFFGHVFQIYIEDVKENDLFAGWDSFIWMI
ncbi:UNVERIFIED_CONTAM: hypothetical protein PYX00_008719 [Menopon gallinae]|uniref:Ketosynthase family 3 (KS3) domain-containing protein n=1 Tax=Menopon gallinae TaxID=328185 RepID=A0AAW2HPE4_9NEOP